MLASSSNALLMAELLPVLASYVFLHARSPLYSKWPHTWKLPFIKPDFFQEVENFSQSHKEREAQLVFSLQTADSKAVTFPIFYSVSPLFFLILKIVTPLTSFHFRSAFTYLAVCDNHNSSGK